MTILPQEQVETMVKVMDDILKYPGISIGTLRKRYNLTMEEYDMIFELCMPLIREINAKKYWAVKSKYYVRKMKELLGKNSLSDAEFRKRIHDLAYEPSYGEAYMIEAIGLEEQNSA